MAYDIFLASDGFLHTRPLNIQMILYIIFFREDCPETIKEVIKPFDWTFTTSYKGTLVGDNPFKVQNLFQ